MDIMKRILDMHDEMARLGASEMGNLTEKQAGLFHSATEALETLLIDASTIDPEEEEQAIMTNQEKTMFILCRSDAGDGGWSLHAPDASDDAIASGEAPYLVSGPASRVDGGWDRPNAADYRAALARLLRGQS